MRSVRIGRVGALANFEGEKKPSQDQERKESWSKKGGLGATGGEESRLVHFVCIISTETPLMADAKREA
jgi:hypothetical protein